MINILVENCFEVEEVDENHFETKMKRIFFFNRFVKDEFDH